MKLSTAIASIAVMSSCFTGVAADYFGYDIPTYPDVSKSALGWAPKPDFEKLDPCKGIRVDSNTKFDHTIEVDHCLLDCNGYTLRRHGLDPVVYVRNGGQLVNCPIEVEQYATGVVCDDGDCLLLDVSCYGDKNFDECVLVKNHAKDVIILLLKAVDPNGTYGVRAINAYDANIWLEASEIKNQRKDGVLATRIKNLIMNHDDISYNGWDGVDARNLAGYVVALKSYFNDNGDEGFDVKHILDILFAYGEANRNKKNGMEAALPSKAEIEIYSSYFDNNGRGTAEDENLNQNGVFIEGPYKVAMSDTYARYNKGDGFKMSNVNFSTVTESYAAYNEADGFDLRRITTAKLYKVKAYQNYLTGVRSVGSGELYVEDDSSFYQNGQDTRFKSKNRSGLTVENTKKLFVSETTSYENGGYGFFTNNVPEIDFEYTKAYDNYDDGFDIETSADVEIKYETASYNNKGNGFSLTDIATLYISDHVKAFKNKERGFDIQEVDNVDIRKTDSYRNIKDGFYVFAAQYFYAEESYGARNGQDGFVVDNGNVHTEVIYKNVIACENDDDGMVFQEGFDNGSFWFTPNYDVFSCDNYDLDLQFDGVFDVSFGSSDIVAPSSQSSATVSNVQSRSFSGGINDITADTCADKNGDEDAQACNDLNLLPCKNFVCPSFD